MENIHSAEAVIAMFHSFEEIPYLCKISIQLRWILISMENTIRLRIVVAMSHIVEEFSY